MNYTLLTSYINAEEMNLSLMRQRYSELESNSISSPSVNSLIEKIALATNIYDVEKKIDEANMYRAIMLRDIGFKFSSNNNQVNDLDSVKRNLNVSSVITSIVGVMILVAVGIVIYKLIKGDI